MSMTRLDAAVADLRWRRFSKETSPEGREPYGYDYARVSRVLPWKQMPGRYTREGDVRELLDAIDDRFVVSRPGDGIALAFDASALPALAPGQRRTFLFYVHGYSEEMDPRSASPDTAAPYPSQACRAIRIRHPSRIRTRPNTERSRAVADARGRPGARAHRMVAGTGAGIPGSGAAPRPLGSAVLGTAPASSGLPAQPGRPGTAARACSLIRARRDPAAPKPRDARCARSCS